tara:strand:+ start:12654 stop:13049 length:396 start_codon:yes stop_codon:yes gene_type:complete
MPILQLNFNYPINDSAQIEDAVFVFQNLSTTASFSVDVAPSATYLGNILEINNPNNDPGGGTTYLWIYHPAPAPAIWGLLNAASDYIMFQKHRSPGVSGVLGYYADMEFRNNSTKKAELFAVGAEIFESSK